MQKTVNPILTIKHLQQSYYKRLESDNMAKGFTQNNPLDRLSGTTNELKQNKETVKKRKVGRPKTKLEDTKTINIAVPVSVLDKLNVIKICYGNNLTQYINQLIKKDIDANYDNYKNIVDSLNNFK